MSATIISIASRQAPEVPVKAAAAVAAFRRQINSPSDLNEVLGIDRGIVAYPTLDAWYRAQPVPKGRLGARLRLSPDEKRLYGLRPSAELIELRGLGEESERWAVCIFPVAGGYIVGVKASMGGGGVGVRFTKSHQASDYAYRLSVEHDLPIVERYA
ncbi:hypothetical protein [Sphingomonas parapaucimobilis]|uniref:Uncharacterized protein n=1 Tax=Sphingomonas parapaucimobilis NBRC 15100 TaxID=1219049 RepID=A0A0A1WAK8_9SPHN|nr:hypothetical protein [Sphingomonas parapaucimobilis]GAM01974.1 hypothetical protein SP5_070_00570 [Sphingomonas parapaucimobilis NBRC 15100]